MKKYLSASALIAFAFVFFSCGFNKASIRFNLSGAVAFGATGNPSSEEGRSLFRAAEDEEFSFIKLLESGEVTGAAEIEGAIHFANLKSIFNAPNSNELYLWFDDPSYNVEDDDDNVFTTLVCLHPDGTYTNLMFQDTQFEENDIMYMENQSGIDFDDEGNAYYLGDEGYETYVYKFNPKTKVRTTLYSEKAKYGTGVYVDNLYCLRIGKDGKYLYIDGSYANMDDVGNAPFLRIVNVETKETYDITPYEEGADFSGELTWTYNPDSDSLFVLLNNSSGRTLSEYTADGKTKKKSFNDENYQYMFATEDGSVFGVDDMTFTKINSDANNSKSFENPAKTFLPKGFIVHKQVGDWVYFCTDWQDYGKWPEFDSEDGGHPSPNGWYDNYQIWVDANYVNKIHRFNPTTMTLDYDILDKSGFSDNLRIFSWSIKGNKLYYTGVYTEQIDNKAVPSGVSGVLKLDTMEHTRISENQRLSCLAAL